MTSNQVFWTHGSGLYHIGPGPLPVALELNEFGSTVAGPSGPGGPANLGIRIPCPVSINGVQGKLLTAFLKYRVAGPPPPAPILNNVTLMDGDTQVQVWLPPLPIPPPGADHVAVFEVRQNVTITSGLALCFHVAQVGGIRVEIIGAGIEIQY